MPGQISLTEQQYYAHPRNAFWRIMATLFNFDRELDYALRCEVLLAAGIAVWDVLSQCVRPGSLDSAIERETEIANDFDLWLLEYSTISTILFNGAKAEQLFKRHHRPLYDSHHFNFHRCPSTSPAYAAMDVSTKLRHWRNAIAILQ